VFLRYQNKVLLLTS